MPHFLYRGVILALFHSLGKILVSIDRLKMSARESEIRSKRSLRSLAKTVSSPEARQAVPIFGAKVWNEIPGRMRDMSKKVFKRKLISVLFEMS